MSLNKQDFRRNKHRLTYYCVFCLFLIANSAFAQWIPHGPGPNTGGQVENILDREVVGAIHALAPHPTDADIIYVGAVNGGIWKTTNATDPIPTWVQQTDSQQSLSIGAITIDPTDATNQSLVAGIGRFSSYFGRGGLRLGILRTINGGNLWTLIDGGGDINGLNITGVVPRGNIIVVSANTADTFANRGIWRTDNTGASWTQISGGAGTGLPLGQVYDLASDPSDTTRLFANAGNNGIYSSTDTGATWVKVSDAAVDTAMSVSLSNIEISVGTANNVFVAIVTGGQLSAMFTSPDGGSNWTAMDVPTIAEGGIHPGAQGGVHLSITADPSNANLVYVGGDRAAGPLPNSIGAGNWTGNLYRGDVSQPLGNQFVHLTHSNSLGPAGGGTASGSSPHADSRDMAFSANGDLLEVDDGGIYRRTSPQDNTGDWFSLNGDIQTAEFYHVAWDSNANIIIAGAQDTGVPEQILPSNARWQTVRQADGGDVAIDDKSTPGLSVRYSSSQRLGNFRRRVYNSANVLQSQATPTRTVIGGGAAFVAQFNTPIELNAVTPVRMIFGANSVYESLDQGDTVTEIGAGILVNASGNDPIAYGATGNAEMLYVGSGSQVFVRTAADPSPLTSSATYPATGTVVDIVMDPDDPQIAYVIDTTHVYRTPDAGGSWTDVTGDLLTLNPGSIRAVTYSTSNADDSVIVGTDNGVYLASGPTFTTWNQLGTGLPTVAVYDLEYDAVDEVLVAGTLGRGSWTFNLAERDAVDVMLVLDLSGSMLSPACPGCDPKLDVLKESAEIFTQLWKALAVTDDRIGVKYFRTNISELTVGGAVLFPVIPNANDMVADINSQTTIGSNLTAMGGGLQQAINQLDDTSRLRSIILFTDGMQNVNPMVRRIDDGGGDFHFEIDNDPAIPTSSGVPPTIPPTVLDGALNRKINTIAVGATDPWVTLLNDIATKTTSLHKQTLAPDEELRRFFVEELVDALRGLSPQLVDYRTNQITGHIMTESFNINRSAHKLAFKLSWEKGREMNFRVEKDGIDLSSLGESINGGFYQIWSIDLPTSHAGKIVEAGGDWQLKIRGQANARYEVAAIADESQLDYDLKLVGQPYRVGDPLKLHVKLNIESNPISDAQVKAHIFKQGAGIGTMLSTTPTPLFTSAEPGASGGQKKLQVLLQNQQFWDALKAKSETVNLTNNSDGTYTANWNKTTIPGSYRVVFEISGNHPMIGDYRRTETVSTLVEFAAAELNASGLKVVWPEKPGSTKNASLVLRPRDTFGNYLGPDYKHQIHVQMQPGTAGSLIDKLDGSYRISLNNISPQSSAKVSVMGQPLFEGTLGSLSGYKWGLSAHLGLTRPIGNFNNLVDNKSLIELDYEHVFSPTWSLNAVLGQYKFDPSYDINGITAYARYYRPFGNYRLFGEFGPGYYDPDNLDPAFGVSFGIGADREVATNWRTELGLHYFNLFNEGDDIQFLGVKLGVRRTF